MPSKLPPEHQARLEEAQGHLSVAERELDAALKALDSAERADKTMISSVLRVAFDKVSVARKALSVVLEDSE